MATDVFGQLALGRNSNPYFAKLLEQGLDTSPIQSKWQGASRMAMALLAGLEQRDQDQKEKDATAQLMNLPGLPGASSIPQTVPQQSAPAMATATPDTSLPRGLRNNNPLNIESGGFTQSQPGYTGSDGRFARFGAQDQGMAAASKLIDIYGTQHGLNTVSGIINRWAPSSDGNNVGNYAASVARDMGVDPNQPLNLSDPRTKQALLGAMAKFENGRPVTGVPWTGGGASPAQATGAIGGPSLDQFAGPAPPNARDQNGNLTPEYRAWMQRAMPGQGAVANRLSAAGPQQAPQMPQGGPQVPPQMAQAGPPVLPQTNTGAPQPMRAPVQIDPAMAARIQTLMANPMTRSEGLQLYSQFAKPREETRPLVDPQERARYGIQPTDRNPYQVDSKGEVKAINPQPFAVNNNLRGESKFEEEYGQGMAKQALGTVESGDKAVENIQQVQLVRGLLNDIKTGKLTPAQSTMGAWMQSVGIDPKVIGIDPNLPATAEAAHALMSKMALSNIGGPGGIPANNFSEADRKFIVNMTSSLSNRPEANEILLDAKERVSQLAMQKADAWAQARERGDSYEKFNSAWRKHMASQNVFGDLIAKADALKAANNPQTEQQPGVRRYNPETGRIE